MDYSTQAEKALREEIEQREQDWRMGAVVYQVLVDRFAPAQDLASKKHLYPAPKQLMSWQQTPKQGHYLQEHKLWSHEIEFWGGDLQSLASKLHYIKELDVDVLYLNPIHLAYTNHKYDALDFNRISEEFGNREDLQQLAKEVHQYDMKLVLDGVFNHMGQNADIFIEAKSDSNSPYHQWFVFGEAFSAGYRAWETADNLPELNLENPEVRHSIYLAEDSTIKSYLSDGIDGWRLDVAHDIGFNFLAELTEQAHLAKPGSLVVGEIWCYPDQWLSAVDGTMNLTLRHLILEACKGEIPAGLASRQLEQMYRDCHYEGMLMSWLLLDNHDTVRLVNALPDPKQRKLAQVMQFTLPASPNIYYGSELGMAGGQDPEMRAPMRWDLVEQGCPELTWVKQLISLRKQNRALGVGNFKVIASQSLIAYLRYTDKVEDSCVVVINPNDEEVSEQLMIPDSKLMNMGYMQELVGCYPEPVSISAGFIGLRMKANSCAIFKPNIATRDGYTTYKRVN